MRGLCSIDSRVRSGEAEGFQYLERAELERVIDAPITGQEIIDRWEDVSMCTLAKAYDDVRPLPSMGTLRGFLGLLE